jgi:membrane-bound ClpP family serine protease
MFAVLLFLCFAILFFVLELLVPSAGILTVLAVTCTMGWIIAAFAAGGIWGGVAAIVLTGIAGPLLFVAITRWWPATPLGRAVLIGDSGRAHQQSASEIDPRGALVGRHGRTRTAMLPCGAIEIDGQVFDAITPGMPLDADTPITVVALQGNSLIVASRVKTEPIPPPTTRPEPDNIMNAWVADPFDES